jgi:hypothetical protein
MPWHGRTALAAVLTTIASCASGPSPHNERETQIMSKSKSRIPAAQVAPLEIDGIRYEQVRNGLVAGLDQMGGYLAARDVSNNTELWKIKVYDNIRDPAKEGDVQDVFFESMQLQSDGTLLIENERGKHFVVDLEARTSTPKP